MSHHLEEDLLQPEVLSIRRFDRARFGFVSSLSLILLYLCFSLTRTHVFGDVISDKHKTTITTTVKYQQQEQYSSKKVEDEKRCTVEGGKELLRRRQTWLRRLRFRPSWRACSWRICPCIR